MYLTDKAELVNTWRGLDAPDLCSEDNEENEKQLQRLAEGVKLGYALQKQFTLELIQRDHAAATPPGSSGRSSNSAATSLTLSSSRNHPAVQFLASLTCYNRNAQATAEGLALSHAYRTRLLRQLNPGDVCSSNQLQEPADSSGTDIKDDGESSSSVAGGLAQDNSCSSSSSGALNSTVQPASVAASRNSINRPRTRLCAGGPAASPGCCTQSSLSSLPTELLDKIFSLCLPKQKLMVSSACAAFRTRWMQERNRLLDQVFPVITLFTRGQFTMFDGFAATLRIKDTDHPDRDITQQARDLDALYRATTPPGLSYVSFFVADSTVRCMFPGQLYDPTTRTFHARQGGERQIYTGRRGFKHIELVLAPHIWDNNFAMELFIVSLDGCSA